MEVRPGYKQTEVGVIPEEWEVKPFAELFAFRNGVNADKASYGQGVRFINVLEPITYSHIYGPEIPGQVTLPETIAASYAVRRGDVLFNRTSETQEELGLAATYLGAERVVFGGFVIRGRPIDQSLDPIYSGYALRAPFVRSQIIPMGQGAIRANIGQQNLGLVVAPVPPLPEQRAIAEALSDVDALLGALDRLIAKKRDLKQAAMQQLLTGQTRLPGFHGEWELKPLGSVGHWFSGGTPSMANDLYWNGDIPWVSAKDMKVSRLRDSLLHVTQRAIGNGTRIAQTDAVLIVVRGMILAHTLPVAVATRPVAFNQDMKALVTSAGIDSQFILVWLQANAQSVLAIASESTHGTKRLASDDLFSMKVDLPPLPEQTAIAEVLSDMDAELAALEQRRDKTRALKQGMMQELLTGRTQLV